MSSSAFGISFQSIANRGFNVPFSGAGRTAIGLKENSLLRNIPMYKRSFDIYVDMIRSESNKKRVEN